MKSIEFEFHIVGFFEFRIQQQNPELALLYSKIVIKE